MNSNSNNSNNNFNTEENMDNHIIESYMNFVDTTNTSIHSMIEIINNQQRSFNQIINRYIPPQTSYFAVRSRRDISDRYFQSTNLNIRRNPPQSNNALRQSFLRNRSSRYYTVPNMNNLVESILDNISDETTIVQHPTSNQILNATEMMPFSDISNPMNLSCPISQVDFSGNDTVIMIKHCRHLFSQNSILRWFERDVHCPLCRYDIRTYGTEESDISGQNNQTEDDQEATEPTQINSPYSTPLPFAQQLANMISEQLTSDRDFSGNINIELAIPPAE